MVERGDAQLSLLELLERPTLDALLSPDELFECNDPSLLASLPEDNRLERKGNKVSERTLAECLSAFGNGPSVLGGIVIVGIEDAGHISGCKELSISRLQEIECCGMQSCPAGRFQCKRIACKSPAPGFFETSQTA